MPAFPSQVLISSFLPSIASQDQSEIYQAEHSHAPAGVWRGHPQLSGGTCTTAWSGAQDGTPRHGYRMETNIWHW